MCTLEERLDHLLALAADAGRLNAEALSATNRADGARRPDLSRRAREARTAAQRAEQYLALERRRFLATEVK